jgi:hypothetical protein
MAGRRTSTAVYGFAAVDLKGRIADRALLSSLRWAPSTRLVIQETGGLYVIDADPRGVFSITSQGHLRLPATVRHWSSLAAGDRVFLAADPDAGRLVVHPPAALDAMVAQFHALVWGGEAI